MNTTHTDPASFDSFDAALVSELRQVVAERATAPVKRTRRRPALVAASIAAVTAGVFGISSVGGAAAYAVDRTADGDITISIHRLDDAAGLEKELASYGIDATVDYRADQGGAGATPTNPDLSHGVPEGTQQLQPGTGGSFSGSATTGDAPDGFRPENSPCGDLTKLPMTTELRKDDYVITIPKDSVLTKADSELQITTNGDLGKSVAGLAVDFTVNGAHCGFGSVTSRAGAVAN